MRSRLFLRHIPEGVVHIAEIARFSCDPEDPGRTEELKRAISAMCTTPSGTCRRNKLLRMS